AGVGLGIGLCSVPYFQCISGIFVHTLSPGSVAHLDGRLRYVLTSVLNRPLTYNQGRKTLECRQI
ncbi:Pro-interleukin-16, partial [Saguinus oedipus]